MVPQHLVLGCRRAQAVLAGASSPAITAGHPFLGYLELLAGPGPNGTTRRRCSARTRPTWSGCTGQLRQRQDPKDGIGDHVIHAAATVNPDQQGTKCAFWYRLTNAPGETAELRLRLRPAGTAGGRQAQPAAAALGSGFDSVVKQRQAEADEFYAELTPDAAKPDEARVMRQAFAGMLWSKQLYYYDVARWLDGDPTQPVPSPQRRGGRTPDGATSIPSTSCRCRTSGNTPGSPPPPRRGHLHRRRGPRHSQEDPVIHYLPRAHPPILAGLDSLGASRGCDMSGERYQDLPPRSAGA